MRQEGVRVASGRRQDNLASGWRQDDVKRRGARINCQTVQEAAGHLPPGDKALWVASWRSAGPAWTEVFCSWLVPEAAEAQLRAMARYDPPGGTSVDDFLHHMLRLADFLWELRNHRQEQLLREPLSAAARVH